MEPHKGTLVITIDNDFSMDMRRKMINNDSSVDILYSHAYQKLDLEGGKMEVGQEAPLYGFSNNPAHVAGTIELPVTFGTAL